MELARRFETYMRDYELTSADGNWDRIRAHLTEDFVHARDVRPLIHFVDEGAEVALSRWQADVVHLDEQFDRRIFVPLGSPRQDGDLVRLPWVFLGVLDGAPAFVDEGVEVARYRDGRICCLRGEYQPFAIERMATWVRAYGHRVPRMVEYFRAHRGGGKAG